MADNDHTFLKQANNGEVIHPIVNLPPLVSSYNHKIRPILDAVDKLRRLKVTQQGIPLPTIVVVGDQSSGKSSVLESLAGISLPRGQGICTRVPLVMRLQHHPDPSPEICLEFQGKTVPISGESKVSEAIDEATVEIAGNCKGISNVPLTLVVKKNGVPDLTMVDLPGITRVAVGDQPKDIYEQITDIIMEYIKPKESIILNVLSATVDFSTCESIRMSQQVDPTGQRTLAVVTKSDISPDGLLEKVTADEVNIGLGYVCVRNRINDETYEEARTQESILFKTHPLLSQIDKFMVGIPVLAQRLVHIQYTIISKCLPDIVRKINDRLNVSISELDKLPRNPTNVTDAMATFMQIVGSLTESLKKILIRGETNEYQDDKQMHCTARLADMLEEFLKELDTSFNFSDNFLVEEIEILEECKGIRLPHFVPHSAFLCLLERKVSKISELPVCFVNKVCEYLETVCVKVLIDQGGNYPQLLPFMKKATQNVIVKSKDKLVERVVEMIEMEKITDYTCDPDFIASRDKLMASRDTFLNELRDYANTSTTELNVKGFGQTDVKHVLKVEHLLSVSANVADEAFAFKMRMTAYWRIVLKRMVDWVALQLQFTIQKLVNKELHAEMVNEVMNGGGGGIQKILEEPPSVGVKRERLQKSVSVLHKSKEVIGQVMDDISVFE